MWGSTSSGAFGRLIKKLSGSGADEGASIISVNNGGTVQQAINNINIKFEDKGVASDLVVAHDNVASVHQPMLDQHNADVSAHADLYSFITTEADRVIASVDDAALNNGIYASTADGLAGTMVDDFFSVTATAVTDYLNLYLHDVGGVAVLQKTYPSAQIVSSLYIKQQETLANSAYVEKFELLDLASQVIVNLTDGAELDYTSTKVPSGLEVLLNTGSRLAAISTANMVGNNKTRLAYTATAVFGSSCSVGVSFYDGIDRVTVEISSAGWCTVFGGGGILATNLPNFTSGAVIDIEFHVDAVAGGMIFSVSVDGGVKRSFSVPQVPIGSIWLAQRNTCTITHKLDVATVGHYQEATLIASDELTSLDGVNINALSQLLGVIKQAKPNGWTPAIPDSYSFYKLITNYFSSVNLKRSLNENDPSVQVLYVDIMTGIDTNNGAELTPLKSICSALSVAGKGTKVLIKVKGGLYPYSNSWRGASSKAIKTEVVSWDGLPVISSMHDESLSWVLDTNNTYTAELALTLHTVFDASFITPDGDYTILSRVADVATCKATAGSFVVDGTTVYVHTFDDRVPDSLIRAYMSDTFVQQNGSFSASGSSLYIENVHFEGGKRTFLSSIGDPLAQQGFYTKNCTFKYSANDGVRVYGDTLVVHQSAVCAWNGDDGFSYNSIFGSEPAHGIESACVSRWNGLDAEGTNNGSTMHDGGWVVRVGGDYHNNQDRNIHDISHSYSWNIGCTARDSQTGNANFSCGINDTDTSKMWLDGCISAGSASDLEAKGLLTNIYTSNLTTDDNNIGNGTISSYVP